MEELTGVSTEDGVKLASFMEYPSHITLLGLIFDPENSKATVYTKGTLDPDELKDVSGSWVGCPAKAVCFWQRPVSLP